MDIYILPKDNNTIVDNVFIRECDTTVVVTNKHKDIVYTPICLTGYIYKKEVKQKQVSTEERTKRKNKNFDISVKQNQELVSKNISPESVYNSDSKPPNTPGEEKKYSEYYIDTITAEQIKLRSISNDIRASLENHVVSGERQGSSICGYYNISNNCPFIEVHWVGRRGEFKNILQKVDFLDKGILGFR